jgi:hypothetical protein
MKTYIWAIDAGHEWLAVRKSELEDLGIAHQISAYSYQKGSTAYLEGDCDAARFLDAYRAKYGVEAKTKQGKHWDRQPCRSFAQYQAPVFTPGKILDETMREPGDVLTNYVEQLNSWNAIFNDESIEFPLTAESAQKIGSKLDCELSPENLHCDGEISAREAQRKYNFLTSVVDELNLYCDANAIRRPQIWEA